MPNFDKKRAKTGFTEGLGIQNMLSAIRDPNLRGVANFAARQLPVGSSDEAYRQAMYDAMNRYQELKAGQNESRERMFAARRAEDLAADQASRRANMNRRWPSLTPWSGQEGPTPQQQLEAGIVGGTIVPAAALASTVVPWGKVAKLALTGTRHPGAIAAGAGIDTLLGGDPLSGAAMTLNPLLGTLATHVGDVEGAVRKAGGGLVKGALARLARKSEEPTRRSIADIVKERGGNWLAGEPSGPPELLYEPTRTADRATPEAIAAWQARNPASMALNKFTQGPLTRYIKTDMATEADPIRKLAEQGIHHSTEMAYDPEASVAIRKLRHAAGFPMEGVAQSELAKQWENAADSMIRKQSAFSIKDAAKLPGDYTGANKILQKNPWIADLENKTPLYKTMGNENYELGFSHLVDELRNAMNPDSGLPRGLQLTPKQIEQMGIEKAVRHVDAINKWRQAQNAKVSMEDFAKMPVHKDYPEQGYRWVELNSSNDPEATRRWLGQEGDVMKHCVGGYCDDVLKGQSRIFSLRDTKTGQPHVTIETQPGLQDSFADDAYDIAYNKAIEKGIPEDSAEFYSFIDDLTAKLKKEKGTFKELPERIVQIKGGANTKPKDEYLPFVQDFVRSGKWSDVGDLQNTGLTKYLPGMHGDEVLKARLLEKYGPPPESGYQYIPETEFVQKAEGGLIDFDELHGYK